jgi:hypothetical protein
MQVFCTKMCKTDFYRRSTTWTSNYTLLDLSRFLHNLTRCSITFGRVTATPIIPLFSAKPTCFPSPSAVSVPHVHTLRSRSGTYSIPYLPSAESCQPFLHLPLGRTVTTTLKCHANISPALTHPTTVRSSHANPIRMVTAPRQLELTGCKLGKANCEYRSPRSVLPTSRLTFSLIFV